MEALVGVLGEAGFEDTVDGAGELDLRGFAFKDGGDDTGGALAGEGAFAAAHFVEDATEGEEVATGIDGFALELFRGHVLQGSGDFAAGGDGGDGGVGGGGDGLDGEPEIEELDALFGEQNVAGFEVAVDDAFFVGGIEGVEDLGGDGESFVDRQGAGKGRAVDVLHDEIVRADVVEGADVGVVEGGNGAGFGVEAVGESLFGELDGDEAFQAGVACFPDFAHAAFADFGEEFVRADSRSGGIGQGSILSGGGGEEQLFGGGDGQVGLEQAGGGPVFASEHVGDEEAVTGVEAGADGIH